MSEFPPDGFEGAPDMPPADPRAAAVARTDALDALAEALHRPCLDEWDEIAQRDPDRMVTMHGQESHRDMAICVLDELLLASPDARRALVVALLGIDWVPVRVWTGVEFLPAAAPGEGRTE